MAKKKFSDKLNEKLRVQERLKNIEARLDALEEMKEILLREKDKLRKDFGGKKSTLQKIKEPDEEISVEKPTHKTVKEDDMIKMLRDEEPKIDKDALYEDIRVGNNFDTDHGTDVGDDDFSESTEDESFEFNDTEKSVDEDDEWNF